MVMAARIIMIVKRWYAYMKKRIAYAFDLDGTITKEEILPCIAGELGLFHEMGLLTQLTMDGVIGFEDSFRLRFQILKNVPIANIQNIVSAVSIDPFIERFININHENCYIITGNLDVWIMPLMNKLACKFYTSTSRINENNELLLDKILNKGDAVRDLRNKYEQIVVVGEGYNDIPMFEEADVGIAFGGTHQPIPEIVKISNHICYEGESLCQLLNKL